ncbi:unnamed protein product, partial [Amoebophrya sp. A25]
SSNRSGSFLLLFIQYYGFFHIHLGSRGGASGAAEKPCFQLRSPFPVRFDGCIRFINAAVDVLLRRRERPDDKPSCAKGNIIVGSLLFIVLSTLHFALLRRCVYRKLCGGLLCCRDLFGYDEVRRNDEHSRRGHALAGKQEMLLMSWDSYFFSGG